MFLKTDPNPPVCDTVDPFAGSYYIESLTNEVEKEALALMQKIDVMGGAVL